MKKILITALAAGVVASSLGSAYAEGANKGEVKAGVIKAAETKDVANSKKKLVIGLIEGYDAESKNVNIKPIFDIDGKMNGKKVYIDLTEAEFPEEGVSEFPKGYLISVYYGEIIEAEDNIVVKADILSSVEADGEVTITEGGAVKEEVETVEIQVQEKNEDKGFFQAIVDFFRNLFKF